MAAVILGDKVYANVWYVLPSGNDTTGNGSLATPYKSVSKACTVASAGDAIVFNGTIDETTSSARRIALPAGVDLIGASRSTAVANLDWSISDHPFKVAVYAADNCEIRNCTFIGVAAAGEYQLMLGYSSSDGASSNVVIRNVRIVGDSDGFYFSSATGTGRWKAYDCVVETKYDAHQMIGVNTNQEINYYNCDLAALAPSLTDPAQATTRAVTATAGIARLYDCRLRAETTDASVPKVECVHANTVAGRVSRIELNRCLVTTRVPSGYTGTHSSLRCESGCTLISEDTNYQVSRAVGTITLQDTVVSVSGTSLGSGAREIVITVDDGSDPLQSARVRLTKGAESYIGTTDEDGEISFSLDDGTWDVTITLPGYQFTPTTLVISATTAQTYSMSLTPFSPSDPGLVTGYYICIDQLGAAESGVTVSLRLVLAAESGGIAGDTTQVDHTSSGSGYVEFTGLIPGSTYQLKRGGSRWHNVVIPEDAETPLALNNIIGAP